MDTGDNENFFPEEYDDILAFAERNNRRETIDLILQNNKIPSNDVDFLNRCYKFTNLPVSYANRYIELCDKYLPTTMIENGYGSSQN